MQPSFKVISLDEDLPATNGIPVKNNKKRNITLNTIKTTYYDCNLVYFQ